MDHFLCAQNQHFSKSTSFFEICPFAISKIAPDNRNIKFGKRNCLYFKSILFYFICISKVHKYKNFTKSVHKIFLKVIIVNLKVTGI